MLLKTFEKDIHLSTNLRNLWKLYCILSKVFKKPVKIINFLSKVIKNLKKNTFINKHLEPLKKDMSFIEVFRKP